MTLTRDALDAALSGIATPDGTPLPDSGRMRAVVIKDGRAGFAIAVAPHEREAFEPVRGAAEAAVRALPGVAETLVALVADDVATAPPAARAAPQDDTRSRTGLAGRARALAGRLTGRSDTPSPPPAEPAALKVEPRTPPHGARPPGRPPAGAGGGAPRGGPNRQSRAQGPIPGVARVVAVGSGKGGVGKSTVSTNLAVALSGLGWRVGLLDADIYGPSVPLLLGAEGYRPPAGRGMVPLEAYGLRAMSIGFLLSPDQAVVWRGPMATGALGQLLRDTKWGELDCLIIDMPPGTGDIQLSLAQTIPLDGAVVVTTPQDLALIDVRKAAEMFEKVHVPLLGVVENMAGFICPHCGGHSAIFGEGGGAREAEARGIPLLGQLPLTMAIREASDAGHPIAASDAPDAARYADVASNLMARLATRQEKPFPEIIFEDT